MNALPEGEEKMLEHPVQFRSEPVRRWVYERSGAPTAEPRNCEGGMATGVAAVITGAERPVFVKALDVADNPQGAAMYQREAELAALLPVHDRIPRLLDAGRVAVGDVRQVDAGDFRVFDFLVDLPA